MAFAIQSPVVQFFDLDGSPLDAGYLYFGNVNQNPETNPVTIYWDAAGTQPAAQPIRTLNGYAVRDGTPARVFALADYSFSIKDRRGRLIVYAPNSVEFGNLGLISRVVAPGQTVTVNVPAEQPTIDSAMAYLAGWVILGQVTIKVADGTLVPAAGISLNHPFGKNIQLIGNIANPASCVLRPAGVASFDLLTVSGGSVFGKVAGFRFDLAAKATSAANFTAVLSEGGGSYVLVEDCQVNNWYYSYAARSGARMRTRRCTGNAAGDVSFWAFTGAMLWADNCTATNASDATNGWGFGFQAEFGGVVEATSCTATACREAGFAALSNGTGRYYTCTTSGNTGGTGAGFLVRSGGKIEANGSSVSTSNYRIFVTEDGGIYNGPANGGGNTNDSNAFVFTSAAGGQAQVGASTGPLRLDAGSTGASVYFNSPDGLQAEVRGASGAATSFAYLQGGSAASGNQPVIGVDGVAADISARYQSKGAGGHFFRTGGGTQVEIFSTAGAVDWLGLTGGAGAARIQAIGGSAAVDVQLAPKGAGYVRFGVFGASGDVTCNGFITIKDAAGTVRKLMTTA